MFGCSGDLTITPDQSSKITELIAHHVISGLAATMNAGTSSPASICLPSLKP